MACMVMRPGCLCFVFAVHRHASTVVRRRSWRVAWRAMPPHTDSTTAALSHTSCLCSIHQCSGCQWGRVVEVRAGTHIKSNNALCGSAPNDCMRPNRPHSLFRTLPTGFARQNHWLWHMPETLIHGFGLDWGGLLLPSMHSCTTPSTASHSQQHVCAWKMVVLLTVLALLCSTPHILPPHLTRSHTLLHALAHTSSCTPHSLAVGAGPSPGGSGATHAPHGLPVGLPIWCAALRAWLGY